MIGVISFAVDFSQRSEESTAPRALAHKTVAKAVNFDDHSLRQLKQTAKNSLDTQRNIQ